MNREPIKQIISRLACLEKAVFGFGSKTEKKKGKKSSPPEGLPAQILKLRDHGYFSEPKTASEVHNKLQPTYHCELNRVVMALLRLQRRKKLRKSSKIIKKKKQAAFAW